MSSLSLFTRQVWVHEFLRRAECRVSQVSEVRTETNKLVLHLRFVLMQGSSGQDFT